MGAKTGKSDLNSLPHLKAPWQDLEWEHYTEDGQRFRQEYLLEVYRWAWDIAGHPLLGQHHFYEHHHVVIRRCEGYLKSQWDYTDEDLKAIKQHWDSQR